MSKRDRATTTTAANGTAAANVPPTVTAPDLSTVRFAQPKAKPERAARVLCVHDGCKLSPMAGWDQCSNHVPAEARMTEQEGRVLSVWLESLTPAERLVAMVRAMGWWRAKQQVSELVTAGAVESGGQA